MVFGALCKSGGARSTGNLGLGKGLRNIWTWVSGCEIGLMSAKNRPQNAKWFWNRKKPASGVSGSPNELEMGVRNYEIREKREKRPEN